MSVIPEGKRVALYLGDCLQSLKKLPDNSIDSVVTDPPYGLSDHKTADTIECLKAWIAGEPYLSKKRGMMGALWDSWVPGPEVWRECLRVLKPGGHMLVFAGTRSMDLMSMAVRLSGFELRDSIGYAHDGGGAPLLAWCYGTGFPKSMDVSKAIDREAGAEREVVGPNKFAALNGKANVNCYGTAGRPDETAPATEAARQWQGYGTAIKPAWEPIIIARKPLEGTVAANVRRHGTGALNIDGCRVETKDTITNHSRGSESAISKGVYGDSQKQETHQTDGQKLGRFPANLVHDGSEEVLALFPQSKGTANGGSPDRNSKNSETYWGEGGGGFKVGRSTVAHNDNGSAARFFYSAKASKADRDEGLDEMPDRMFGMSNKAKASAERGEHWDNGDSGVNRVTVRKNTHPTVKPTALMQWLCRLITPPGGIVLDPFMGSGSTGKAAMLEGFRFVGMEMSPDYMEIAKARIRHAMNKHANDNTEPEAKRA